MKARIAAQSSIDLLVPPDMDAAALDPYAPVKGVSSPSSRRGSVLPMALVAAAGCTRRALPGLYWRPCCGRTWASPSSQIRSCLGTAVIRQDREESFANKFARTYQNFDYNAAQEYNAQVHTHIEELMLTIHLFSTQKKILIFVLISSCFVDCANYFTNWILYPLVSFFGYIYGGWWILYALLSFLGYIDGG